MPARDKGMEIWERPGKLVVSIAFSISFRWGDYREQPHVFECSAAIATYGCFCSLYLTTFNFPNSALAEANGPVAQQQQPGTEYSGRNLRETPEHVSCPRNVAHQVPVPFTVVPAVLATM